MPTRLAKLRQDNRQVGGRGSHKRLFAPVKTDAHGRLGRAVGENEAKRSASTPLTVPKATVGQPALGAASSRDERAAQEGRSVGVHKAGCPTVEQADGMGSGKGARYWSGCGRPARKTVCRPNDQRAVVPRSPRFKRLLIPSACRRRSARRSHEWAVSQLVPMTWDLRCGTGGSNPAPYSARAPWLQRAAAWDIFPTRTSH